MKLAWPEIREGRKRAEGTKRDTTESHVGFGTQPGKEVNEGVL